jgi:hypothetical protein
MYTSIRNDTNGERRVLFSNQNDNWPADAQAWKRAIALERNQSTGWDEGKRWLRYYTGPTAHSADIDRNGGPEIMPYTK